MKLTVENCTVEVWKSNFGWEYTMKDGFAEHSAGPFKTEEEAIKDAFYLCCGIKL